jgi:hypothetical protein
MPELIEPAWFLRSLCEGLAEGAKLDAHKPSPQPSPKGRGRKDFKHFVVALNFLYLG